MLISSVSPDFRSLSTDLSGEKILNEVTMNIPAGAGELLQGQLLTGEDFLITNPVYCFSKISASLVSGTGRVVVSPAECIKVQKAVTQTLRLLRVKDKDIQIKVESAIPVGKGMASSTADIVGAVEATAKVLHRDITAEQVSDIAISIEPSDGLMHRGIVIYNHRRGYMLEDLGPAPDMRQLIVDTGGCVDTISFNTIPKQYRREEIELQAQALDLVRDGIRAADIQRIGAGATLSASINQRLLPKTGFAEIVRLARACDACGVACAHSGTILALLFAPENTSGLELAWDALRRNGYTLFPTHSVSTW